ncbi:hypothetical protein BAY61_01650 [Prauserella marina]|uniref:Uncharacterized protein n=1 Tax=Prauserella marina TaxID=530584 RepID=A0A222VJ16_9PSEU|nr:hypothetical protein [Prauserella marina]ASR33908.1 hypothetical protein BAY61_01650 [Prauserella marina]PWV82505.1 hypothetical protein DES30_102748 [Prauserella marina]SDC70768.1 hypothetical protein SAMN05421630_103284 [Prauserella marina]
MSQPVVDIAEQPGVGLDGLPRPSEDVVVTTGNAVVVLDGATEFREGLPSGGWYATRLGERIESLLLAAPYDDLGSVLGKAIADVTEAGGLTRRHSPASTVAMLRWTDDRIDALVLADSPIVAFGRSGFEVVADTRLDELRGSGRLRTRGEVNRLRNSEGGFWVAEADPGAANRALRRSWAREEIEAVVLATDGVAVGVDDYRVLEWPSVLSIARERGAAGVLDAVRAAELGDPGRIRWPRAKRHDDQALALIDFTRCRG